MTPTLTIEQAKDAAARELGYDSFANANTWMHKHGQQFTEDPDNNIMFNIYNRAMALCIEGEMQRIAKKVKKHFEIYVGCPIEVEDTTPSEAYAKGYTDAISELKKQLTNK